MSTREDGHSEEQPKVVIRDRRRIDPETGAPREVAVASVGGDAAGAPASAAAGGPATDRSDPASSSAASGSPEAPAETQQPGAGGAAASGERHETQPAGGPDIPAGSAGGPGAGGDAAGSEESGGDVSAHGSTVTTGAGAAKSGHAESAGAAEVGGADRLATELKERTADLQRITAEYANYRRRVERDRQLAGEVATGSVLTALLPVLDDMDRARAHGDLTGAFAAVSEQLVASLTKLGLTPFGEAGDPFDPTYHEAVAHTTSPDVTEATCVEVFRKGYSLGERLLRAAMVVVADPGESVDGGPGHGVTTRAAEDVVGPSSQSADDEDEETAAAAAGATGDPAAE